PQPRAESAGRRAPVWRRLCADRAWAGSLHGRATKLRGAGGVAMEATQLVGLGRKALGRLIRSVVIGTVALSGALVVGMSTASAAPTLSAPAPSYRVGIAIIPAFAGPTDIAVSAYPGELIDYARTGCLNPDPPARPTG